jgi:hypothetical protein
MKPEIPIPERLQKRPLFQGMVIPFTTLVHEDGTPDFRVTDETAWNTCLLMDRCAMCGDKNGKTKMKWFIGGPLCIQNCLFFDLAMHAECAIYAIQVCPYIATARGHRQDLTKLKDKLGDQGVIVVDKAASSDKPTDLFIMGTYVWRPVRVTQPEGERILAHVPVYECVFSIPKEDNPERVASLLSGIRNCSN